LSIIVEHSVNGILFRCYIPVLVPLRFEPDQKIAQVEALGEFRNQRIEMTASTLSDVVIPVFIEVFNDVSQYPEFEVVWRPTRVRDYVFMRFSGSVEISLEGFASSTKKLTDLGKIESAQFDISVEIERFIAQIALAVRWSIVKGAVLKNSGEWQYSHKKLAR
jgi:hypothetical protein